MTNNTNGISTDITIDNNKLETVRSFKYLRSIVSDEGSKPEVLSRISQTTAAVTKLKVIWNDMNISISSKIRLMRSLAMSIFLYASHDHLDWPSLYYRGQFKEGDEGADRGNDGKTTSKSGLTLNGISYYAKPRVARSEGSWL